MEVKFKVLSGKNAGQELPIAGPQFLIGRDEKCQLRPRSDSIAPRHCSIMQQDGRAVISDLGSETGTFVNDRRIDKPIELRTGDKIKIGALEFEVHVSTGMAKKKLPKVTDASQAAERLAGPARSKQEVDLDSLFGDAESMRADAENVPKPTRMSAEELAALGVVTTEEAGKQTKNKSADAKPSSVETGRVAADMLDKMRRGQVP